MAQSAVRTAVGQYDISTSFAGRTKRDVEEMIHLLDASWSPLVALTGEIKATRNVTSRKFEWQTDADATNVYTSTYTGYTTTGYVEVSDANSDYIKPGDVLYCPDMNEHIRVDAIGAAGSGDTGAGYTKLTVTRAFGENDSAGTLLANYQLVNIGPIAGEKAAVPAGRFLDLTQAYNYAQLFLRTVQITKDVENSSYYGGAVRAAEHEKAVIEYNKRREFQGYFGARHTLTAYGSHATDAGQQWATGGLKFYISTNSFNFSGATLTESLLLSKMDDCFRYGNHTRKILIGSPQLMARMASWALPNVRTAPTESTWGFSIKRWETPMGTIDLAPSWLLRDVNSSYTSGYSGDYFFVIDPSNIKLAIKESTSLETNVQNSESIRTIKDCYSGVAGWQITNEQFHAIGYGWV